MMMRARLGIGKIYTHLSLPTQQKTWSVPYSLPILSLFSPYPVETYISVHSIEGLDAGLYHFDAEHFTLDRLTEQDQAEAVAQACLDQKFIAQAPVIFLWTAVFRRAMSKYGDRGMRYILLDAGHICQNLLLAAEAVGCGGCPIGAFYDSELNQLLQIDGEEESILYATSVGRKILSGS
jgi:SagB-type dehydrogenase family enzyme